MCGIVGYLGKKPVVPLLVDSLRHLEYRGYDSAGIAYLDDENLFQVYKACGKLVNLENILPEAAGNGTESSSTLHLGIGHIRWATHGAANEINAHPHTSNDNQIALVHNGIIENFYELRQSLAAEGVQFSSDTDTECVVHLLNKLNKASDGSNFIQVLQQALKQLKGAYALTLASRDNPDRLYAVRNHAPLVIGVGSEEYLVASDAVAVASHHNKIIYLKDREIAEISPEGVRIFNLDGEEVQPIIEPLNIGPLQIDKKGFKHFMMKEIHEQPDVVRNSLAGRLVGVDQPIDLTPQVSNNGSDPTAILNQIDRIVITGCGTSFNAGLVGKYFIEELVRIPVEVESAGEYRYRNPVVNKKTLIVAMSQSGETADTLEAVRQSSQQGAKVLTITNREDSSIAREADIVLSARAGVEVSVCATKTFVAQIIVLYLLGLSLAETRGTYPTEQLQALKSGLLKVPTLIESVLSNPEVVQPLAKKYGHARDLLFIARGINYPVALEGALKLKEISYIHAEGYSASELKHGPIAMLDEDIPVLSILVPGLVFDKSLSNAQEAKARDARSIGLTTTDAMVDQAGPLEDTFEDILTIPQVPELLSPLVATVPLQLFAYYIAEHLGKDVDQPRNLAKSVTVE
ncbi:MAG: glutamine--fructose-6-phosphate transaminase (isomerizing) [Vampirovibrio sp.]|nr:glutamine--fructose-6-phosphate transaminase (isomerizing) [Vampirovibrio sp.]